MNKSARFRQRHPERARLYRMVSNLRSRGASPGKIAKYERLLKESPLNNCPECGESYRSCKGGEANGSHD